MIKYFIIFGIACLFSSLGFFKSKEKEEVNLIVLTIGTDFKENSDLFIEEALMVNKCFLTSSRHKTTNKLLLGENANKVNVLKELSWLKNKVKSNDIAIVYITAHGGWSFDKGYKLCPYDFCANTFITGKEIYSIIGNLPCMLYFILDTCHSEGILLEWVDNGKTNILTACEKRKYAYVLVLANKIIESINNYGNINGINKYIVNNTQEQKPVTMNDTDMDIFVPKKVLKFFTSINFDYVFETAS